MDIKVNDSWPRIKLECFRVLPSMKSHTLFYSNGLVIWNAFPDIMNIEVNNGRYSATWYLIDEISQGASLLESAHFVKL